ncbi:MFS transporter [Pseudarthrobacter sp. B4EP4b]|uniref:MFS transporter n=1 Tax=Pseudarthrobacter sp. B4EP4b TaxID=2590664 RepID=UPI0015EF79CC|nr:MFS transporter [Pseudarthrobacter sp. B4EP4b]
MSNTTMVSPRRAAAAGFFGGAIEFYDFFIYGTAAAVVLNALFFSGLSPAVGTLAAFATLAVGYIVRPLGAVVFGHIGDKYGRKNALMGTLMTMGGATVLIGILPTTAVMGDWAAVLLILLRVVQGLGLGGEMGNAATLSMESSPEKKRGFYTSFTYAGGFVGMVLATAAFALVTMLPKADYMAWGWRLPFLFSGVLLVITYLVRRQIPETPASEQVRAEGRIEKFPIIQVARKHKKDVLLATIIATGPNTVFYTVAVFGISFAVSKYGVAQTTMLALVSLSSALLAFSVPLWGKLSDRMGRRKLIIIGLIAEALFTFVYFMLLGTSDPVLILLGMVLVLCFGHGIVNGIQAALFTELFPIEVRASAVSLGQQLGGAISGFGPLVAAAIIVANPDGWYLVALYAGGLCLLGAVAAAFTVARWGKQEAIAFEETVKAAQSTPRTTENDAAAPIR